MEQLFTNKISDGRVTTGIINSVAQMILVMVISIVVAGCQSNLIPAGTWPVHDEVGYKPNQCPDITGTFYDLATRSAEQRSKPPFTSSRSNVCRIEPKNETFGHCSLIYLYDPVHSKDRNPDMYKQDNGYNKLGACPPRSIEFKRLDNETYSVISRKGNTVLSEHEISLKCEHGKIIRHRKLSQRGTYVKETYYVEDTLFLHQDALYRVLVQEYDDFFVLNESVLYLQWNKQGSGADPYQHCITSPD